MATIDITDKQNIQILLEQAKTDRKAAAGLLKAYSQNAFKEAALYLDDEQAAKNIVLKALNKAYRNLKDAEADSLAQWVNSYVQQECINAILPLEKAESAPYTDNDEVPDLNVVLPADQERIKGSLRAVLKRLTPTQRLVSVLKYRDQHSFSKIADICYVTEADVKNVITQIKKTLKANNLDLGGIFAMINRLYPYYEEPEKTDDDNDIIAFPAIPKTGLSDEEEFNTAVQELKTFFNTKAMPTSQRISDREIDDTEEPDSDDIEKTFEMQAVKNIASGIESTASSAKKIIAAAMTGDSGEKVSEKEYNPKWYWIKRILFIVVLAVMAFIITVLISMIRANSRPHPEPSTTPEIEETETVEDSEVTEEQETAEETAQAEEPASEPVDDGSIGTIYVNVTDLSIRTGPGVGYAQAGVAELNGTYTVYETSEADGYTWYKVGDDQWISDLQGQYVTFTAKS